MLANVQEDDVRGLHARLMAYSQGKDNDDVLACILSTWQSGGGALPQYLGLQEEDYFRMLVFHFPGLNHASLIQHGDKHDAARQDEIDEVVKLLIGGRAGNSPSEEWLAVIVAMACQGQDHLWQDLGVWSRNDLSGLLNLNFPALAQQNTRNMKWKKFIYKQLCVAEGIYTCRSPSCEVCVDYNDCFGPED
jgi:nitrogen fixation protein NifQ